MSRSVGRWIGIVAICAAILLVPIFNGALKAAEADSEALFWLAFSNASPVQTSHKPKKDCAVFNSRKEAQTFFLEHRPLDDPYRLDAVHKGDRNGQACENFDYQVP